MVPPRCTLTRRLLHTASLSSNGLKSAAFASWFNANIPFTDMVMTYVVKCALASGKSLSFTDPVGTVHTWAGNLGLAPTWSGGSVIRLVEQQLVSACLGAHANKYGVHVAISVRGWYSTGSLHAGRDDLEQAGVRSRVGLVQSCAINGKNYPALNTFISRPTSAGDGVCQLTESCYSAATGTGCLADCGACP